MPIKFHKVDPTPVPQPPPTYSITGLGKTEARWLRNLLSHDNRSLARLVSTDERGFLQRLERVVQGID